MRHPNYFTSIFTTSFSVILLTLFTISSAQAVLILSAPPREDAANGKIIYGPLADYLSNTLGEKVIYKHPNSWADYQRDMQLDKYDIVFDGPHFISWRMKNYKHIPVAKLSGKLGFVLIARKDDNNINLINDLVGKTVCAISPPNLSTLTILNQFGDMGLPKIKAIKGGMGQVLRAFKKGECRAAVLRDKFYNRIVAYSGEDHTNMKIVFSSNPISNQGISVSSRVSATARIKITIALTEENFGTRKILSRFSPGTKKMISAGPVDYLGYDKLLSGAITGW